MVIDIFGQPFDLDNPQSTYFHGDCMEGMKAFPDKYFDLAVVDPPYGEGGGKFSGNTRFGGLFERYIQPPTKESAGGATSQPRLRGTVRKIQPVRQAEHGRQSTTKKS